MAVTLSFEEQFEIPMGLGSLADFRRWAQLDEFPQQGRIDYVAGRIEVDMSPEDIFSHGTPKMEIAAVLHHLVKRARLGYVLTDRTRISSVEGDVSAEPDVVFLSHESLDSGRARLMPKAGGEEERYIEVEGAPDLIVEIVSDSSKTKDTKRLPPAYFQAGVREFWLADARREPLVFRIHARGESGFEPLVPDAEGYQASSVLPGRFRLDMRRDRRGHRTFDLLVDGR